MRSFYFGIYLILITTLQSCSKIHGDCDMNCFTPPQPFLFNLVDKSSGDNVFGNGTFTTDQVAVSNSLTNENVDFNFVLVNGLNLIRVNGIGWETEIVNLQISLANDAIFECYVDAIRSTRNCCNFTEYNEIKITGSEYDFDSQTGIYTIYLP